MPFATKIARFFKHELFFTATMLWFTVQSIWLAFSAIYPLPFDEYYHWTLTKIYSTQWSPFISEQGPEASILGDITRTPNYLYHYLLSMPYRFFSNFINDEITLLILLRLINVSLVLFGLFAFKRLLKELGVSKIAQHISIALFTLTPIVPFLSAHLNYDNAQLALFPMFCLLFLRIYKRDFTISTVLLYIITAAVLSLMKVNSLPVVALTSIVVFYVLWVSRAQYKQYMLQLRAQKLLSNVLLLALLVMSLGLFTERYIGNILTYGSAQPACETLQPVEVCRNFAPFARNERAKNGEHLSAEVFGNPLSYTQHWTTKVMRGYYAIFSHVPSEVVDEREPFGPIVLRPLLPIPVSIGYLIVFAGSGIVAVSGKKYWRNKNVQAIFLISLALLVSLWLFNYIGYLNLGRAYAIQARYTLPVILLLLSLIALSLQQTTWWRKKSIIAAFMVCFMAYAYSGGIAGHIIRSDSSWFIQKDAVIESNETLRNTLKKLIVH